MGGPVVLKYLKQLGEGRWEYRRRVPESAKQTDTVPHDDDVALSYRSKP